MHICAFMIELRFYEVRAQATTSCQRNVTAHDKEHERQKDTPGVEIFSGWSTIARRL